MTGVKVYERAGQAVLQVQELQVQAWEEEA